MAKSLPGEMIEEILIKLPAKSLVRFRCVSKPWLSLIQSSNFATAHLAHHNARYVFWYLPYDLLNASLSPYNGIFSDHNVPPPSQTGYNGLVGSCNGLICCVQDSIYYIWNPVIRKLKFLPEPLLGRFTYHDVFGFNSKSNDYKVVRMLQEYFSNQLSVEVYSLRTNSWERMNATFCPSYRICLTKKFLFANGKSYWIAKRKDENALVVAALDIDNEKLCEIPLPKDSGNISEVTWWESKSREVSFALSHHRFNHQFFDIWLLQEGGSTREYSWTKQFSIPYPLNVVGLLRDGNVFYESDDKRLFSYEPENQSKKDLGLSLSSLTYNHLFDESLLLLDDATTFCVGN